MGSTSSKGRGGRAGKSNAKAIRLTIPSDHAAARKVQKRIMDRVRREKFDSHSVFAINLALEEAMVNAIRHGNKLDRRKKVHIDFAISPKRAEIVIEDEG